MNLFRASFDDEGELLIETRGDRPASDDDSWFESRKEALKGLHKQIRQDIFAAIDDLAAMRDAMLAVENEISTLARADSGL